MFLVSAGKVGNAPASNKACCFFDFLKVQVAVD
jgi:hypothetical protein